MSAAGGRGDGTGPNARWLVEDTWRAHVSWLTPPWVAQAPGGRSAFDARMWFDTLQAAGYRSLVFYTKHADGFCAWPSRFAAAPERDFYGECVAEARARSMRIMAYYSTVLDEQVGIAHPDWRVLGRDGRPAEGWYTPVWPHAYLCLNNPGYRQLMLGQVEEIARYGPDALWLDIFSPNVDHDCSCPHCRRLHAEETGKDIGETRGREWYRAAYARAARAIRDVVQAAAPGCLLTYNAGNRVAGIDEVMDFSAHEGNDARRISQMCRGFVPLGRPAETTYRLYSTVGSWSLKGHDRVLLETMASLAHGVAASIEVSPLHGGGIQADAAALLARVGRTVRDRERWIAGARPLYDAALFLPGDQYGAERPAGWGTVFAERDVPFGLVYADRAAREGLRAWRLVVVDDADASPALAPILRAYVEGGGCLLVEYASPESRPLVESLQDVLGVRVEGDADGAAHYLAGLDPALREGMGADEPIVEGRALRVACTTARPLAFLRGELVPRAGRQFIITNLPPAPRPSADPAVTVNSFGKGRAMLVACPLASGEIRRHGRNLDDAREVPAQLAENLVRSLLEEPLLRGTTPACVEVTVNALGGAHVVHLLNRAVEGPPVDGRPGLLALADVRVAVNERRLGSVRAAAWIATPGPAAPRRLAVRRDGPWAGVTVPRLGVHGMIVLDH